MVSSGWIHRCPLRYARIGNVQGAAGDVESAVRLPLNRTRSSVNSAWSERMSVFICGTFELRYGAGKRRFEHDWLLANAESIDNGSVAHIVHVAEIVQ